MMRPTDKYSNVLGSTTECGALRQGNKDVKWFESPSKTFYNPRWQMPHHFGDNRDVVAVP